MNRQELEAELRGTQNILIAVLLEMPERCFVVTEEKLAEVDDCYMDLRRNVNGQEELFVVKAENNG